MKNTVRISKIALAICISLPISSQTLAAGFRLHEQSTSAMGTAYAGLAARAENATILLANPAGMVELKGSQLSIGANLANVTSDYKDATATSMSGLPVVGSSSGELEVTSVAPHFFYTRPLNDRISYGVGLFAPYAMASDYDNDWVGRYFADKTELLALTLQPSIAYKINDQFSVGLGLAISRMEGELSKYKDHFGLCEIGEGINAAYNGMNVYNEAYCDSHYKVEGDAWDFGFTLGLHWKPLEGTTLGLVYHSEMTYELEGDSEITNVPVLGLFAQGNPDLTSVGDMVPAIDNTTGKLAAFDMLKERSQVDIVTPQSITFSLDQTLTENLSFQATVFWEDWSSFTDITIQGHENGTISTLTENDVKQENTIAYIPEYWEDTVAISAGLTWQANSEWVFRAGYAYDHTPVNKKYTTARVPDDDRQWVTVGAGWKAAENWSVDFALGYMWTDEMTTDENEFDINDQPLYLPGRNSTTYETSARVLSVQLNYIF